MTTSNLDNWLLDQMKNRITNYKNDIYRLTEQADKIIIWLVGFSISSIALIMSSNSPQIEEIENFKNIVVILGSLTVIFGVLYRIAIYIAQSTELKLILGFIGYIEGYNSSLEIIEGRNLDGNETLEEILYYLKEDFSYNTDLDASKLLSPEIKAQFHTKCVETYNKLYNYHEEKKAREINNVKNILKTQLGYSEKKVTKVLENNQQKTNYQNIIILTTTRMAKILFLLSCTSFCIGMTLILIGYIC